MKIPILVEPISGERYRATASELFLGTVEGETPDAALVKMKERIEERRFPRVLGLLCWMCRRPQITGSMELECSGTTRSSMIG